jgi:N-methylhydantoinase B
VPLKIGLTIRIDGERMTLDFSETSPACLGPVNISRSTAIASCYVALKHVFQDVPANAGVLEPIEFVIPEDSLLSVHAPRPVGGYTETILRVIDVIFGALAEGAPERVNGCAYGTINALSLAGHRTDGGRTGGQRWVMFSFFGGGHGGHPEGDGLNHGNAPISTATIPPMEIFEAAYPIQFTEWALRPDSGGPGRHRGGLGAIYEIELLEEQADAFLFGERGKYPPQGVVGGKPAALNRFTFEQDDGDHEPPFVSKMVGIHLRKGQKVRLETPGGGGYGPPLERDPKAVARDVALGYVTRNAAREQYGVVLAEDGSVDADATAKARRRTA